MTGTNGNAYPAHYTDWVCIGCSECGLKTTWYEYVHDAIKAWNKRTPVVDEYDAYRQGDNSP